MRAVSILCAIAAFAAVVSTAWGVPVDPVFDVETSLVSVTDDGVGYVWQYQVCASPDTNRGLSFWMMSICGDPGVPRWDLDPEGGVDYFDLDFFSQSGGDYFYTSGRGVRYEVEFGSDPHTGLYGIKFEHADGDGTQIGDEYECDTFEFRLLQEFEVIERDWGAKGACFVEVDEACGPACVPTTPPEIPEPATVLLVGLVVGGSGLIARRRRR